MSTPKCKNAECDNMPKPFKSGKYRTYCCTACSIKHNCKGRDYANSKNGVEWQESEGLIMAMMKIARRDRKPWRFRCRTCACAIEHEINMVEEGDHHYCSEQCHELKLTNEMLKRPPAFRNATMNKKGNHRKSSITEMQLPPFFGKSNRGVS